MSHWYVEFQKLSYEFKTNKTIRNLVLKAEQCSIFVEGNTGLSLLQHLLFYMRKVTHELWQTPTVSWKLGHSLLWFSLNSLNKCSAMHGYFLHNICIGWDKLWHTTCTHLCRRPLCDFSYHWWSKLNGGLWILISQGGIEICPSFFISWNKF